MAGGELGYLHDIEYRIDNYYGKFICNSCIIACEVGESSYLAS